LTAKPQQHGAGLAAYSIHHPVGITMIALAIMVLGGFSLQRLGIDLLPDIIYPEIRVRVLDPGVPAAIMEDRITRQLEEQLAITEGSIGIQSKTTEGRSSVDLSFPYGTDMDTALRDASTRLDRAKRFLPDTIDPPVIYKRDPSQRPVLELVVSSDSRPSVDLREWVDYRFSKWFLNLPGVAAAEVGGAPEREVQILPDPMKLFARNLEYQDLTEQIDEANRDEPAGRLTTGSVEFSAQTRGRFRDIQELSRLPITTATGSRLHLEDLAQVMRTNEDERLRIRLNGIDGVKLSIQKQPQANTVDVVDHVQERLDWLKAQNLLPDDVTVRVVGDQSIFIRDSMSSAAQAALGGALLAMIVVYLFLGDLRRTLIIGSVIPVAILITFIIMAASGLTLNIMTLGGLALGVGLLVDNTIVMMENITRHQTFQPDNEEASIEAAAEVHGAIIASTSTNLAAVLPFLFIGGLIGLLFNELIITISASIIASLLVAITLVPAYAARVRNTGQKGSILGTLTHILQGYYVRILRPLLHHPWLPLLVFIPLLAISLYLLMVQKQVFLPQMDQGQINMSITSDPGTRLKDMNHAVFLIEERLRQEPNVVSLFSTIGGFVFGRSEYESSNRSSITIQLKKGDDGSYDSDAWIKKMTGELAKLGLTGFQIRMRINAISGIRISRGDDDVSIRVQGEDLDTLNHLGNAIVDRLQDLPGLRNLTHTYEDNRLELNVHIDRERAALLNIDAATLNTALKVALDGVIVSQYIEDDRDMPIRLRLPRGSIDSPEDLEQIYIGRSNGKPVMLGEIASVSLQPQPMSIQRDQQQRIVEVTGSLDADTDLAKIYPAIRERLSDLDIPKGYALYEGGSEAALQQGQHTGILLSLLALFLVYVVMAVQYESLRNPLIILCSIPFSLIGVALGIVINDIPISMPVWLGIIMLAGIVVNNAIVLVEQIEILRGSGMELLDAIRNAGQQRLRPILMTVLTTVFGMLPLALGVGDGSEMLQPLAIVIAWGLSFSILVSLLMVPAMYRLFYQNH
jgi:multidrug efflux pump subunit AcrB